jgi:hypothetical protein
MGSLLADAHEALDQLDSLTRLLEPYEAIFCLDIVRDMLAVIKRLMRITWMRFRIFELTMDSVDGGHHQY